MHRRSLIRTPTQALLFVAVASVLIALRLSAVADFQPPGMPGLDGSTVDAPAVPRPAGTLPSGDRASRPKFDHNPGAFHPRERRDAPTWLPLAAGLAWGSFVLCLVLGVLSLARDLLVRRSDEERA